MTNKSGNFFLNEYNFAPSNPTVVKHITYAQDGLPTYRMEGFRLVMKHPVCIQESKIKSYLPTASNSIRRKMVVKPHDTRIEVYTMYIYLFYVQIHMQFYVYRERIVTVG